MDRRRRRRNIKRIRQRNRRVLLVAALFCFIVWSAVVNIGKQKEREKAEETYAEQQEKEAEQNSGQAVEIKLASAKEKKQWYLKLVNADNPMTEKDVPEVAAVPMTYDEYEVDARILDDLEEMFEDAQAAGRSPMICSAFRAWDTQVYLHQNKIDRLMNEEGLDKEDAAVKAATVVAKPGTSEHQIGLAVDIVSSGYTNLDEGQMKTKDQKWLIENCWKYGFILRYPLDKSEITGVIFEPWHYRYVGKKAAREITEQGLTLEEYLGEEAVGYPEV